MAQVPEGYQLLVDDGVHLAAVPEVTLQQEAAAAGLQDWGSPDLQKERNLGRLRQCFF